MTELDYMEYSSYAAAQAAYVTSDTTGSAVITQDSADDQNNIFGSGGTEEEAAQSFTPATAINCSSVQIYLEKVLSPTDDITVRIETNNAGVPSGTLVNANATKTIATASLSDGYNSFAFPASFILAASVVYHIVCKRSGSRDATNYWRWTLLVDTNPYADGNASRLNSGTWSAQANHDHRFKVYSKSLQCYADAVVKTQGSYSLKGYALVTSSLNETLTGTLSSAADLTDMNIIRLDLRATRTGANIKIGIHDSGGTTTELTPTISSASTYETQSWDISGVANADKDDIDQVIITIVNADAANTFYLDNMYGDNVRGKVIFIGDN
jgi:hypothetical protein